MAREIIVEDLMYVHDKRIDQGYATTFVMPERAADIVAITVELFGTHNEMYEHQTWRLVRTLTDCTQREMALHLHVKPETYARWERSFVQVPWVYRNAIREHLARRLEEPSMRRPRFYTRRNARLGK